MDAMGRCEMKERRMGQQQRIHPGNHVHAGNDEEERLIVYDLRDPLTPLGHARVSATNIRTHERYKERKLAREQGSCTIHGRRDF